MTDEDKLKTLLQPLEYKSKLRLFCADNKLEIVKSTGEKIEINVQGE